MLLSTIYVAVFVPYSACFPETFELPEGCPKNVTAIGNGTPESSSSLPPEIGHSFQFPNFTRSSGGYFSNGIKSPLFWLLFVVDVIVEIVFIIGKFLTASRASLAVLGIAFRRQHFWKIYCIFELF